MQTLLRRFVVSQTQFIFAAVPLWSDFKALGIYQSEDNSVVPRMDLARNRKAVVDQ